ncbi:MAG: fused MFS/spermidine synthase [Gammaproteobacteria bacterium]|nr:fused MFS/spermidine synthase [Gammaproteobacteria bacterium]
MTRWSFLLFLFVAMPALAAEVTLHSEKSLYRNITVTDDDNVRCLKFTHKRRASQQSCIDTSNPYRLVLPYTHLGMGGLLISPRPERVLVLGLGGGTIPDLFAELYPGIEIDVVEIDPAVVAGARRYFGFKESAGTRVFVEDGRVNVRRALRRGKKYDYILLDAFNGDYIPEHMMTQEFLQDCKALLTKDGVLVANTFSSSRLYNSESATYESVFGPFLNLRRSMGNRIVVAGREGIPETAVLGENISQAPGQLRNYGVFLEQILAMDQGVDWRRRARILTDQYAPANLLRGRD